ncbi:MAG: iron-sulfur cluster repair di-iron protein [Sandaracinaceae bacterium]|nr:iron-sulfur cluster repair di-iron protein [Sandaracinaceae bacterium]
MFDTRQSVASLVLDHSECASVFQRHRIDFCCKGNLSIEEAAREKGVALPELEAELASAIASRRGDREADPRELPTARLLAHIIARHHEYLRKAMPFVVGLATKVSRVHGEHNPKLRELEPAVNDLANAIVPHLDEEEERLFPLLVSPTPDRVAIATALAQMHAEHLEVAEILRRIRAASEDFTLPAWACNSYRTLFAELAQMETDVFTHVHLENHVLGPRFASA